MEVPKPSDELDLTGNPCGVDEEALGSKFGRHTYFPDVVDGLPPHKFWGSIPDCLPPLSFTFPTVTV